MKPDVSPSSANPAEAEWVEVELVRGLLRATGATQLPGLLLIPIVVAVLWGDSPALGLALWVLAAAAMGLARFVALRRYSRKVIARPAAEQMAFFKRYRFIWPLSALVWGSMTLLYFDRAPLSDQFISWLILAGIAMFSIYTLSSRLETLRAYLDTLTVTALAVMLWRVGTDLQLSEPPYQYWLIVLLMIFWLVLRRAGRRLHLTHRKNFELQYRNNQLIESLTRQTQAALEAVEIKNRFLASAAHDIRQPVHALSLYADWLGSEPELVHEIAPKIVESTKAVNALFDSLFDLVRLDSGKVKLDIEPVDLAKLLHDIELQFRPLAKAKGLQFRVHVTPGTVVSDPILLRRIVGNLVSNAVKYTNRGGVLLASRVRRAGRCIEIWDTGVGIAPEHQREVFREFYKIPGHAGTEEGFGLGLSIVERLTHILGHPLRMASRPGQGTVFRLQLLPTDAHQAAVRAAATVAQLVNMP